MAKLPDLTSKELIAALTKIGFQSMRQKGSHVGMKHNGGRVVTIPDRTRGKYYQAIALKICHEGDRLNRCR